MTTATSTRIATCPNGHKPDTDTPFVYPPRCIGVDEHAAELGVLAYADTLPANRWADGTVGVPTSVTEMIDGCMPVCVECGAEAEWAN